MVLSMRLHEAGATKGPFVLAFSPFITYHESRSPFDSKMPHRVSLSLRESSKLSNAAESQ